MTDSTATPTITTQVLARMRAERAAWDTLVAQVPDEAMTQPGVVGSWSIKDLLAHIAVYERWTAAQIRADQTGVPPTNLELYGTEDVPDESTMLDTDSRNAAIQQHFQDVPLSEVKAASRQAFTQLLAAVEGLSDEALTDPQGASWWPDVPLAQAIALQTYEHYHQHIADLGTWFEANARPDSD